jgi:hypothetical protein
MINNPNAYNKDGTPRILNTIPYINKLLFKKIPSIDDIKELINHTARSVVEDFHIGHVWEDGDYVINWRMHKVHLAIEAFNSKQYHEAYCQIIKFWANDFDGSETDMADKYRFPHYIENADCEMTEEEFTTCTNRWFIYKPNHSKILEERDAWRKAFDRTMEIVESIQSREGDDGVPQAVESIFNEIQLTIPSVIKNAPSEKMVMINLNNENINRENLPI